MILVIGSAHVAPDKRDAAVAAANQMTELSRAESGCLHYGFYVSLNEPHSFLLYEEWESEEALQAHFQTPHMAQFQSILFDLLDGTFAVEKYSRYDVSHVAPL